MADFVSPLEYSPIVSSGSSSKAIDQRVHDDELDNACSICLEPFNDNDPPTVTNCRHEYHLQCVLEWSQRRSECPICWQLLVLEDPVSQELLAAMGNGRNLMLKSSANDVRDGYDINHVIFEDTASSEEDSDFEPRIMHHFAAAARRARLISRTGREISSRIGRAQSDVQQTRISPEQQRYINESSEGDSPTFGSATPIRAQYPASSVTGVLNVEPHSVGNRDNRTKPSQHLPESPQRPSSSEFSAFSDSVKSKFSAASAKYKESISKGTRGFKEKLMARNITVKELGKGVQREMNAGIAGVTRIIERFDLASKRNGVSAHLSSCTRGTSNSSSERKEDMQRTIIAQDEGESVGEKAHAVGSAEPSHLHSTISSKLEVSPVEVTNDALTML